MRMNIEASSEDLLKTIHTMKMVSHNGVADNARKRLQEVKLNVCIQS